MEPENHERAELDHLLNPPAIDLGRLEDVDFLSSTLKAAGLSDQATALVVRDFSRCLNAFQENGPAENRIASALFVPGRIEVLGKHTDYAGGGSLICSLQRGIAAVILPREDSQVTLADARSNERAALALSPDQPTRPGDWSNYAIAVVRRLARDFGASRGADIVFASGLPSASGMSSSSALTVAFALGLGATNDLHTRAPFREAVGHVAGFAQYLGAIENGLPFAGLAGSEGVGTFGGSEDHTAILCSQRGLLKWFMYRPVRLVESVPWPEQYRFVLAVTGVRASKTREALERYNYLSETTAEIARLWRSATGGKEDNLGSICCLPDFSLGGVEATINSSEQGQYGTDELARRLRHFHQESRVLLPEAVEALRDLRLNLFGSLVDESQRLAESLLRNQIPETEFLAREGRRLGAVAASAFGAGFGGSVWAMVAEERIESFLEEWSKAYAATFPSRREDASFFVDGPGPAAFWLGQ